MVERCLLLDHTMRSVCVHWWYFCSADNGGGSITASNIIPSGAELVRITRFSSLAYGIDPSF